jgi:hypothetical protein
MTLPFNLPKKVFPINRGSLPLRKTESALLPILRSNIHPELCDLGDVVSG